MRFERCKVDDMYGIHIKRITKKHAPTSFHRLALEKYHVTSRQQFVLATDRRNAELFIEHYGTSFNYFKTHDTLEREGKGRHRLMNGPVRRHLQQIMPQQPSDRLLSITDRVEQRNGVTVSPRILQEARLNENYNPVHARVHWQINEQQAARRFQCCYANRSNYRQNIIFSDEKNFQVDETGTVYGILIGGSRPRTFVG
ncbi:unnamed protein product [Rotaria socialis]|nr:unnamed protein product [Rotaria socialis]